MHRIEHVTFLLSFNGNGDNFSASKCVFNWLLLLLLLDFNFWLYFFRTQAKTQQLLAIFILFLLLLLLLLLLMLLYICNLFSLLLFFSAFVIISHFIV